VTFLGISVFLAEGHRYDFRAFYVDGDAWNHGLQLYSRANLNPPSATLALFAPLARLSFARAQIIWTLAGTLGVFCSGVVIARELAWTPVEAITRIALLLITHAAYLVFAFGQVTWVLLLPATLAWIFYRRDRPYLAGVWFGVLIAFKPSFAVSALVLSLPVWVTAGAVSIGISAICVSVTGWGPWQGWFELGRAVSWIEDPLSASIWGLLARFEHVSRLSELSAASIVVALSVSAWAIWRTVSVTQRDERLVCAWLLQTTIAPLGWIYYLPLAFGPVAASWQNRRRAWIALGLVCVPLGLVEPKPFPLLMGLTYPLALVFAWAEWGYARGTTLRPDVAFRNRRVGVSAE
jgi:alpha-1,2-mannosyltransferase